METATRNAFPAAFMVTKVHNVTKMIQIKNKTIIILVNNLEFWYKI